MFRKIITYFLILAVVLPVLAGAVPFGAPNQTYARTATPIYDSGGELLYYETTYYNKTYDKITRREYDGANGAGRVEEEYYDSDGMRQWRQAKYSNADTLYEKYVWQTLAGAKADFNEEFSDIKENVNQGKKFEYTEEMKSPCSFIPPRLGAPCIGYIVAQAMYYTVFSPSYYIALMAGGIFNASIGFSLSGESFPTGEGSMIATGWKMVRDLLNLFFIFILLYVAIATIIQYGSFGKDAIVKIIIAAVLINFSLMMTKMVIDSSHILAWGFYDKIEERETADGLAPDIPEELEVKGIKTKNLAGVFMAGFNPQKLLIPSSKTKDNTAEISEESDKEGSGILGTVWKMFLIMILASALNFIAAFILFAGAILFIIRVVVLWFVLLFSPLAFAYLILPSFKQISSKWWDALIKQAFFAPAFLFLFYLVTMMVNGGFLNAVITGSNEAPSAKILFFDAGGTIVVFFHFFVIGSLLVGCLYLAQQMGAHGAGAMMKWGNKTGDWARNKFGDKAAWRGTKYGLRYGGGVAGDSNWWAKSIGRIPGGSMLGRKLGAMKKADEDKAKKAAEKYATGLSDAGFESLKSDTSSKSFIKRLAYSGPEGAFPSSKKGYENVAIKKKAEEEKKKRIKEEERELETLNKALPKMGPIKEHQKARLKDIEKDLEEFDVEIKAADYELAEAVKSKNINEIDRAKQKLKDVKKEPRFLGLKTEKKVREEKIKDIEKHEARKESLQDKKDRRKETEGLQEVIKTSGSSGSSGSGGGGGGGKTTP